LKFGHRVKTKFFLEDQGSTLIEVVAFAVVAFGLVLTLGFQMLEQERKVLELQSIARNSMRSYLLSNSNDILGEVSRLQSASRLWSEERIAVEVSCVPARCSVPKTLIWLELSGSGLDAKAFGVQGG
jgi:hypothetical protein